LIANIFGTHSYIENRKSGLSTTAPPTLAERKIVNFGPQTKKLLRVKYIDHNVLYSGDYISALRGCCPLKFLHALQIDQGLLVHTPKGNGGPPKNFNRENLKFGLKFSVLASITSGLLGVSSQNFFQSACRKAGLIKWVQFLEAPPQKICENLKFGPLKRTFWDTIFRPLQGAAP